MRVHISAHSCVHDMRVTCVFVCVDKIRQFDGVYSIHSTRLRLETGEWRLCRRIPDSQYNTVITLLGLGRDYTAALTAIQYL